MQCVFVYVYMCPHLGDMRYVLKELGCSQEEKKLELAKVCNVIRVCVCAHI